MRPARLLPLLAAGLLGLSAGVLALRHGDARAGAPVTSTHPPSTTSEVSGGSEELVGTWANERGSVLRVQAVADGVLQGSFQSAVGRVDRAAALPIVGVVRGDVVGFSVDFGPVGSVASWTGQLEHSGPALRLVTQWHLVRDVAAADERDKLWSSTLSGADVFVRQRP